uniref:UBL3-like ubiquitin domain-containing protein n=1 Tax=Nelumbo nucifera TaxID=4432 RepID=A0A822YW61_NELNU|nr:TPA_asm: hypothetical protein HUJ06_005626 [Nelumbo nucifera]
MDFNWLSSSAEKENGPKTVKDLKIISAGKILENNRTLRECKSPIYGLPGGVITMHVIVQHRSDRISGILQDFLMLVQEKRQKKTQHAP